MCVKLKVTVLVWRCKLLGLGNYGRVLFSKHPIRRQSSSAVGDALWQLESTLSRSDFLKFAQAEWTRTYRDNASARAALFTRVKSRKAKVLGQ